MTEPVADKGKKTQATASARAIPRLLQFYRDNIVPSLISEFGYKNVMEVPRLEKVVVNIGLGEALTNPKALESATNEIAQITGQQPVVTRAKKSIASFKLREGQSIGVMVTLRQSRMYYFLDKLLSAALPRVRDFRGVSRTAFDGSVNFALGLREQIIFPEIDYNQVEKMRGLQINIITTARSDREGLRLLELAGMPFTREATKAG